MSENRLVGIKVNKPFVSGVPTLMSYMRYIPYALKLFLFGIWHRNDFDLIYCLESFNSIIGLCISSVTGIPFVRETVGVTRIWTRNQKSSKFLTGAALLTEKIVSRYARMTICLSEADRQKYISDGFNANKVTAIPLIPELSLADSVIGNKLFLRKKLDLNVSKRLLIFLGRRDFPPNMNAVNWINSDLAPAIAQRRDDVEILMTSFGDIPKPTHPILTYTGFVPNIYEYLHAADIFISPIEQPSGVSQKVIDAMTCSKPMVVMASLTNGIPELSNGYNVMLAKDRADFIEKTLYLLEHLDDANEMGIKVRKTIEEYYDQKAWRMRFNEFLKSCAIRQIGGK
jgi:glycosyltransferase involved in cell wall biosynthesis